MTTPDVIDTLVGIAPGSALDAIRARRTEARRHAQASYLALFEPAEPGDVSLQERFALAHFVSGLHRQPRLDSFYADKLAASGGSPTLRDAVVAAINMAASRGPYGSYPKGPLSREDSPGAILQIAPATRGALGERLASAFEHTHMLVYHPRDSAAPSLQAMLNAGWSTTSVVTVSQLVSFLAFQIRVVVGLRALAAAPGEPA